MFQDFGSVEARMEILRREAERERLAAEVRAARRDSAATKPEGRVRTEREADVSPGGRIRGGRRWVLRWGAGA
ncbi:hypothetical protein [Streptomyces sp. NBC_01803]|uniref:hypothetical protein n=1 Tax=Streptomyces sp. NBC_01803 TaxID=2975946 RepID=UPI002DDB84E3|nr:hypothetical protein [Streptomyces sp. NBC_01803]WSA44056.1 hypothetical protein OIE51_07465 [Streptomyces sp. NBC_01803]